MKILLQGEIRGGKDPQTLCQSIQFFLSTLLWLTSMIGNCFDFSRAAVIEMAWIMLRIDYSRLFWLLFGVFSYENHEGKPRI